MARERGTCSCCRRVRQLVGPPDLQDGSFHWFRWCAECTAMTNDERKEEIARGELRVKERNLKARKAYPVIGGPLDGQRALTVDFQREWKSSNPKWSHDAGMYAHLAGEYREYNSAGGSGPSMIFVHVSCLQPTTPGRNR